MSVQALVLDPPGAGTPALAERDLIGPGEAAGLAAVFKVLSSDTRLRLLHALARGGEVRVSDLAAAVGMTQQAVSNQLQRLVDRRICATRRSGTAIFYRITDPCVTDLLEHGLCLAGPRCAAGGS